MSLGLARNLCLFLVCDAMLSAVYAVVVCLSVCVSLTFNILFTFARQ